MCWRRHGLRSGGATALNELNEKQQSPLKKQLPPISPGCQSPDFINTTNIAWLMRQVGVASYEALHQWSVQNREMFWALVIERLGIRFQRPFGRVMDLSQGVETPRWLVDARLNIVESCFTAPADSPAIIHQAEGGELKVMTVAELAKLTDRVAANLRRRGFKPGDALAIIMPMTAEAVAIYLGIIKPAVWWLASRTVFGPGKSPRVCVCPKPWRCSPKISSCAATNSCRSTRT